MAHNGWKNKKLDDFSVIRNERNETRNKIKDDINGFQC